MSSGFHNTDLIVEVNDVTKRFGDVVAVEQATFEVRKGQIISLLGPSGCGKTTTLRLIAGFETLDAEDGEIRIAGEDMRGRRPYERNVGLLFQDYALFPHWAGVSAWLSASVPWAVSSNTKSSLGWP